MEVDASIVVALVTGGATLAGVLVSNNATRSALEQKVDDLSERVEKHNSVIERVYGLEGDQRANEERFKTLFNAINVEERRDSDGRDERRV